MKNVKIIFGMAILLLSFSFTILESIQWKLKEGYSVKISGGKVNGIFKGLKASIVFDESNPEKSKITASIDANTINTGNGMMNKHAMSEDALDTEKFPTINFESTSIVKSGSTYIATGKLTMKGVTKEIKLPFSFQNETFSGKFTVAPKEYSISRGGTPDQIEIELTIPVTK